MGNRVFNSAKSTPIRREEIAVDRFRIDDPAIDFVDSDDIDLSELPPAIRRKIIEERRRRQVRKTVETTTTTPQPTTTTTTPPPNTTTTTTTPAATTSVQTEPEKEVVTKIESDETIRNLIKAIPIANPGSLITDEYHNSLRAAVNALGRRLGVKSTSDEYDILTFAPNFLPVKPKNPNTPNLNWNVTLERAAIPAISANDLGKAVAGGLVVQLPDVGDIHAMVVWGNKAKDAPAAKGFTVTLMRKKLGSSDDPQALITIDLKDVKDENGSGAFHKGDELTEREIALLDEDEGETGKTTLSRRRLINNEKWVYFVTAEFTAGSDTQAEKYEINSIQIYCLD